MGTENIAINFSQGEKGVFPSSIEESYITSINNSHSKLITVRNNVTINYNVVALQSWILVLHISNRFH